MNARCFKIIFAACSVLMLGVAGLLIAKPAFPQAPASLPSQRQGEPVTEAAPRKSNAKGAVMLFAALLSDTSTDAAAGGAEQAGAEEKKSEETEPTEEKKEKLPEVHHPKPEIPPGTSFAPYDAKAFGSDPTYGDKPYDAEGQVLIYGGKHSNPTERPMLEWGRELYREGPLSPSADWWGKKNPLAPHLYVYGDWRTAVAHNDNGVLERGVLATRLNLEIDLQITSTERIHAFFRPLDRNGEFTRTDFSGPDRRTKIEFNGDPAALFFEGDMARIVAGATDQDNHLDMPFAFGLMPLLFQNGVWVEDAFEGVAFTIPARNSPGLDISNADITFFVGIDEVTSGAIKDANNKLLEDSARVYGFTTFIETMEGYWEGGYGFTDAFGNADGLSYHNLTAAFTRRYADILSNTIRVVGNIGQEPRAGQQKTADGCILLIENSFITFDSTHFVPYLNAFVGVDRPQSLARAADAGGILKNTGILFETDGLTGFPKMDDTGNGTYGAAFGLEYLFDLHQQIVFEVAALDTIGDANEVGRPAKGEEIGVGLRYQLPISHSWLLRADAMRAWRDNTDDLAGIRFEVRHKF